ncbi:MAG: prenyltransferase/squalene oxidase repeat-containing protein [Planctomycetaceae bacterium]
MLLFPLGFTIATRWEVDHDESTRNGGFPSHELLDMDAGRSGVGRSRFSYNDSASPIEPDFAASDDELRFDGRDDLRKAIVRNRDALLAEQQADGHFCAELEGDSILESEYLLLLAWLGRDKSDLCRRLANELLHRQESHGGWAQYPGGPTDVSASVKAYLALRVVGHDPQEPAMKKACEAVLAAGGAERVNSFTRYYLALLGIIGYHQCPAVPPELVLLPRWCPFNIYEMSAWSRTIVVPLSLLWAFQPKRDLPSEGLHVRELFLKSPEQLPVTMDKTAFVETAQIGGRRRLSSLNSRLSTLFNWQQFFRGLDRLYKGFDRIGVLNLFRVPAVRKADRWMVERFTDSDGLGAIFPPIIWSVVALKCLGRGDDDSLVQGQLRELERLHLETSDERRETRESLSGLSTLDSRLARTRVQPCKSPVWDTAIATIALRESGLPPQHPAVRQACGWLLKNEVRRRGDWSLQQPDVEASGWAFEYANAFYPDTDDTAMVLMALVRSLPATIDRPWAAEFLIDRDRGPGRENAAILSASEIDADAAIDDLAALSPMLTAIWRGVKWVLAMQGRDGGWGAFDKDNTRWLFTQVPFADHNAMIDPSTSDLAARLLELFGLLHAPPSHPAVKSAVDYVSREQEADGSWFGRWGVNYLYGTWQALLGLTAVGVSHDDKRIRNAVRWIKSVQQPCGGWGESVASYDDPSLRGQGNPTASQTAWAVMGLVAAGEAHSGAAERGVQWLIDTQHPDGTWDEPEFTGTGFPQVFYLRYHYYRLYFPLLALARYEKATRDAASQSSDDDR